VDFSDSTESESTAMPMNPDKAKDLLIRLPRDSVALPDFMVSAFLRKPKKVVFGRYIKPIKSSTI
jgi:hypothetical protein